MGPGWNSGRQTWQQAPTPLSPLGSPKLCVLMVAALPCLLLCYFLTWACPQVVKRDLCVFVCFVVHSQPGSSQALNAGPSVYTLFISMLSSNSFLSSQVILSQFINSVSFLSLAKLFNGFFFCKRMYRSQQKHSKQIIRVGFGAGIEIRAVVFGGSFWNEEK